MKNNLIFAKTRNEDVGNMDIEEKLEEGNVICIKPRGYSMYPLIVPGRDAAWIEKTEISKLRRGDVILYRRPESILVLHRIWKREGDSFFLVGDNQKEVEGPLPKEQIRGKMIAFTRNGKKISVRHPLYQAYGYVWLSLRPFRPWISRCIHWFKMRVLNKGIEE